MLLLGTTANVPFAFLVFDLVVVILTLPFLTEPLVLLAGMLERRECV
jgi:hypothetical protein